MTSNEITEAILKEFNRLNERISELEAECKKLKFRWAEDMLDAWRAAVISIHGQATNEDSWKFDDWLKKREMK